MNRIHALAVGAVLATVYLGGIAIGELLPRYELSIQNGVYARFDRWTGRVEVAWPTRPAAWMQIGDPFSEALRIVREDPAQR